MAELYETHPHLELLSQYHGANKPIWCRCNDCGYVWNPHAQTLQRLKKCPRCSKKQRQTTESFKQLLYFINPMIDVLGEYKNIETPILCQCKVDGYMWMARPHHLKNGVGCPKCAGVAANTIEDVKDYLEKNMPNVEVVGEYINNKSPLQCVCKICGQTWTSTYNSLMHHHGCPHCAESHGEKRVRRFLDMRGIKYVPQMRFDDCRDERVLPFDIYIPSKNMVIEYDGEQHFGPVKFGGTNDEKAESRYLRTVKHDRIKDTYCAEHEINMLRIPYTEYDNIETILDKHLL